MLLAEDLYSVRQFMTTNFLSIEQVDLLLVLRHVEEPVLVMDLLAKALHWLVGSNSYDPAEQEG